MKIKYIIITRFNLDYKKIVKENLKTDPEEWLEKRIKLFFRYCYPSILNQSDKDFEWWVFFDLQTNSHIIDEIRNKDKEGLIEFKFSTWGKFRDDILFELNKISGSYDYLLNARIDSDDAISKYNIEEVKKYFLSNIDHIPNSFVLNPLTGLVFDTDNTILYQKKLKNNPFQVLVQKHGKVFNSVFTFQHQTASINFPVFNISKIPFWLMVVHETNWQNIKSGRPVLFRGKKLKRYFPNLILPKKEISIVKFTKESLFHIKYLIRKAFDKLFSVNN
ncbi:MAG: hypothetical protein HWD85_13350 [Flavobacteriaceae bacterium]|nr:hypothetical protein [Flavobacteriaceae bacterium]